LVFVAGKKVIEPNHEYGSCGYRQAARNWLGRLRWRSVLSRRKLRVRRARRAWPRSITRIGWPVSVLRRIRGWRGRLFLCRRLRLRWRLIGWLLALRLRGRWRRCRLLRRILRVTPRAKAQRQHDRTRPAQNDFKSSGNCWVILHDLCLPRPAIAAKTAELSHPTDLDGTPSTEGCPNPFRPHPIW
jgi:hypothetical protein